MSIELLKISKEALSGDTAAPRGGALDSGLYPSIIEMAYFGESRKGALSLELIMKSADNRYNERRFALYLTTNAENGRKNVTYRDGQPRALPGMDRAEELHRLLCKAPIANAKTEKKVIKKRNWETGQDEPTEVTALVDLIGKPVIMVLEKQDTNGWNNGPTNEHVERNEIVKFLDKDGFTVTEREGGLETPHHIEQLKKDYPSTWVRDKFRPVKGAPATRSAATDDEDDDDLPWPSSENKSESSSESKEETVSLFNNV